MFLKLDDAHLPTKILEESTHARLAGRFTTAWTYISNEKKVNNETWNECTDRKKCNISIEARIFMVSHCTKNESIRRICITQYAIWLHSAYFMIFNENFHSRTERAEKIRERAAEWVGQRNEISREPWKKVTRLNKNRRNAIVAFLTISYSE